jgi:hypothetical protein
MKGAGLSPPKEINQYSGNASASISDNETEPEGNQVDTATLINNSTTLTSYKRHPKRL